jgi:hypothetical protein
MRLASASVMVVIELVKIVPVYALPTSIIQISTLIFKCVKILSRKCHKLFEVRVGIGTRPLIVKKTDIRKIMRWKGTASRSLRSMKHDKPKRLTWDIQSPSENPSLQLAGEDPPFLRGYPSQNHQTKDASLLVQIHSQTLVRHPHDYQYETRDQRASKRESQRIPSKASPELLLESKHVNLIGKSRKRSQREQQIRCYCSTV